MKDLKNKYLNKLNIYSEHKHFFCSIGVGFLLLNFIFLVWNICGSSHNDDAIWHLAARSGQWSIIKNFATSQGRLWAFVSGSLLYLACYLQDTFAGNCLRVGMLVVFFILFYKVIAIYIGKYIASFGALLNLALFALRWEGSIITSYPLLFFVHGSLFLCSLWLGTIFLRNGSKKYLLFALITLFIALFGHESSTCLFIGLSAAALLGNVYLLNFKGLTSLKSVNRHNNRFLAIGIAGVIFFYCILYFSFHYLFPTTYDGHHLGSSHLTKALPVLISFCTRGSVLSDIFYPYSVIFSDRLAQDGFRIIYYLFSYLKSQEADLTPYLVFLVVFSVTFTILIQSQHMLNARNTIKRRHVLAGLLGGGLTAVLPVFPLAFSSKYQYWFHNLGVTSNTFTPLSHFGVTLFIASLFIWIFSFVRKAFKPLAAGLSAMIIAVLAFCGFYMNKAIAFDMYSELVRWKVVDEAASMTSQIKVDGKKIWAPRLSSGSWFTCVNNDYWSNYLFVKHKKNIFFSNTIPSDFESNEVIFMDYKLIKNSNKPIVLIAPLSILADDSRIASSIAISMKEGDVSDMQHSILSFVDKVQGEVSVRFSQLDSIDKAGKVRLLSGLQAIPSSIRLQSYSMIQRLIEPYRLLSDKKAIVQFGTLPISNKKSYDGSKMLTTGWSLPEPQGVWSNTKKTTLAIPTAGLKHVPIHLTFDIGTFASMGGLGGAQEVSVFLDNILLNRRVDRHGKSVGFQSIDIEVLPEQWIPGEDLQFSIEVDNLICPQTYGQPDHRELGVYLHSLMIETLDENK